MMSRRQALRSYRRQFRRACNTGHHRAWYIVAPLRVFCVRRCVWWRIDAATPEAVELGRRGDRLQTVYAQHLDMLYWPVEVVEALTSRDVLCMTERRTEPSVMLRYTFQSDPSPTASDQVF